MLELRNYQQRSLHALESYLRRVSQLRDPKAAFIYETERPYRPVPQLPGLPYVCLRVPTGGGKTLMACHAIGIAATEFLQSERAVCLWLVPSNTIRDQTLAALRDLRHPYREAVTARFGGRATVLDLTEALYVSRATLAGETTIIVATLAALRVEDTDGRKVYETNGQLMPHFTGLPAELEAELETQADGVYPKSLCNVLRLWRPVVIVDEAHNARTPLSFDTLARFKPSCILEFTATPQLARSADGGTMPSNVLHHVSAAELKVAEMVKLPIKLSIRTEWKEAVGLARQLQHDLEQVALAEQRQTGEYIRPIVLLQAQAKSQTRQTLTVDVVKQCLLDDYKVPEEQIAIATGDTRQIDDVDLFDRGCPIRFVITVAALKEGWDCSFAYVFCSVADVQSSRAVEQLLGRVLRMPKAKRKQNAELNCAYAVVASNKFLETANSLKDSLIENGFERIEAESLVRPLESQQTLFGAGSLFPDVTQQVPEAPDLSQLAPELRERVTFDPTNSTLTVTGIVDERQRDALAGCFTTPAARRVVESIYRESQGRPPTAAAPVEPATIRVPLLGIRVDGRLQLFDEDQFRDAPWDLTLCDAELSETDFPSILVEGTAGQLDVSEAGKVEIQFVERVQRQLHLIGIEPNWDMAGLTNWIDRQIDHPDLTRTQATLFIHRVLTAVGDARGLSIDQLARLKFPLKKAIAERIDRERRAQHTNSFNRLLFTVDGAELEVGPELCLEMDGDRYEPNWYYDGRYRWSRHFLPTPGELKAEGEEFECATFIDQLSQVKRWARNLERRANSSFWLQTATDRFYPDFVALLNDGRILVVEYKGADRWSNDDSKEKRAVGELWANRSGGMCLFVMPKGPDRGPILEAIGRG